VSEQKKEQQGETQAKCHRDKDGRKKKKIYCHKHIHIKTIDLNRESWEKRCGQFTEETMKNEIEPAEVDNDVSLRLGTLGVTPIGNAVGT